MPSTLATCTFCGLLPFRIDFSPTLGAPSESDSQSDAELESSDGEERPDPESLSLSSEALMDGRVWLEPAGERDLSTDVAVLLSTCITAVFGVGAPPSDSDSESLPSSDEDSDDVESELDGSGDIQLVEHRKQSKCPPLAFNLHGAEMVAPPADFDPDPGMILFASPLRDLPDSEPEAELDSSSDSESELF